MRITIVFDEEDYITPGTEGLDDLLKMLADVMTEASISGTFFIIGERLRCLKHRGRTDVLQALCRHDIGSHTDMGSVHPTLTERMEHADWADGLARMAADELGGIDEMETILGKPIRSFARHGGSYAPQLVAALARRRLPYVYSPAKLPGHHITWFCNTLNFFECATQFQQAYLSQEGLLKKEHEFFNLLENHKGYDWLAVFHSHPCMIKTREFWDANYYRGSNPTPDRWLIPRFRTEYQFDTVKENWALHCHKLRQNPDLKLGTIAEFASEFGQQAASAGLPELRYLARRAAECDAPFFTNRFSAAEILDLLARWFLIRANGLPCEHLLRRDVLGPAQMPLSVPSARNLEMSALTRIARGIVATVETTGMLPSRLFCGEGPVGTAGEVGPGTALVALGTALTPDEIPGIISTHIVAPHVMEAEEIAASAQGIIKSWPIHRPDLDCSAIARLTRLQSWTLKPAWPGNVPRFEDE